ERKKSKRLEEPVIGGAARRYMNDAPLQPEVGSSSAAPVTIHETIPYGSEQGGLISWFRRLFSRTPKLEPEEGDDLSPSYSPYSPFFGEGVSVGRFVGGTRGDGAARAKAYRDTPRAASPTERRRANLADRFKEIYGEEAYTNEVSVDDESKISGLFMNRLISNFQGDLGEGMDTDEILSILGDLSVGTHAPGDRDNDERYQDGLKRLKEIFYTKLKQLEATYGTLGSRMHPEDFLSMVDDPGQIKAHLGFIQDAAQILDGSKGQKLFDMQNFEDRDYVNLLEYYKELDSYLSTYSASSQGLGMFDTMDENMAVLAESMRDKEESVAGPTLTKKQTKAYQADLKKRAKAGPKGGLFSRLFGRFK
ncbi:MAG: hypothetical protein IJT34_12040, partial [Butyrivibrio sp.]|nr:hypothetical protein [Butyrivibrio sp.]